MATARATSIVSSGRRATRRSTARDTARGPRSRTAPAWATSAFTPSDSMALSSSPSSSRLQPVDMWHALAKASSAPSPRRWRTSSATAPSLSAPGRSDAVIGSEASSPSSAVSAPASAGRRLATTSTDRLSSRRTR